MHIPIHTRSVRPVLAWFLALLATAATAQTTSKGEADSIVVTLPTTLQYQSAISAYQAYTDQPVQSWRETNDRVGQIGGWRAYAKEVTMGVPAKESPVADPHSGHHRGAKP